MSSVARNGSFPTTVHALVPGTVKLVFAGAKKATYPAGTISVAKGTRTFSVPGNGRLTATLTKAGNKLFASGQDVKGTLTLTFTKAAGGSITKSMIVTLTRR